MDSTSEIRPAWGGLLDPLMRLSALHMLLYMLRRANEEVGEQANPNLYWRSPHHEERLYSNSRRKISEQTECCQRALFARMWNPPKKMNSGTRRSEQEYHLTLSENTSQSAMSGNQMTSYLPATPRRFLKHLEDTRKAPSATVSKVHMEWARQIGLAVSRRGTGTWYSPDDSLLKALVMCTVDEGREEYHRFLAKLYDRFRLVIGASEAEKAFGTLPTDQNAFMQNTQRLEQRLKTLGLLRRLSDDCAYVENPL